MRCIFLAQIGRSSDGSFNGSDGDGIGGLTYLITGVVLKSHMEDELARRWSNQEIATVFLAAVVATWVPLLGDFLLTSFLSALPMAQ